MKRNKFSIKWKVFGCLAVFTAVIIGLLWLFQTVFLEDFYKMIKMNSVHSAALVLEKNIGKSTLGDTVAQLSQRNDICIRIITVDGKNISSADASRDCMIHKMRPEQLIQLYLKAVENNGTYTQAFEKEPAYIFGDDYYGYFVPRRAKESIIYVKVVEQKTGEAVIMLNAMISPVDATVQTLRIQLLWISAALILLALILALIISKAIAKPIEQVNRSAKALAAGQYRITFPNDGYREISELGDTMNYAAAELEKTEALRRELIANVSHDLRTPLTMITGYAEIMRDLPGENTPENVQIIIDEATRLTALVNDMLDISKLQSGTLQLNLIDFSLTEAVKETLQRYHKLIEHEGYEISFRYEEEAMVTADPLRISQVIYNLVNNAISYTGEDKKIMVNQSVENGWVRISVTDTGEGIEPEMLPMIWDRYYKVDKTHKRAVVGTGLGLSIVKSSVDLHGGRCGVFSTPGEGSTFWFELKVKKQDHNIEENRKG